jgi:cytochrome c
VRDELSTNKLLGAVLGTALGLMGLSMLGQSVYHREAPEVGKQGWNLPVPETEVAATDEPAEEEKPLGVLLASADVASGEKEHKKCTGCHVFEKDGANKQGPVLWDVVERDKAVVAGFNYSEAAQGQKGDKWTYDNLYAFIENPAVYMPGTAMKFGGIKNDQKRADLLAYLATLSDAPKPFPAP